jgi:hypothetical protein
MASGLALMALLPSIGAAQSGRLFDNSWFWGAKGGIVSFSTTSGVNKVSPVVGVDWLITRSQGALYVSADQAFFTSTSTVPDNNGAPSLVGIHNMRRYTAALLAFPVAYGTMRPYGGIGFSLNVIQGVSVADTTASGSAIAARAFDEKDRAAFIAMAGLQAQMQRLSVFGQVTYMPAKTGFLLNGRTTYFLEAGVRYNVGTSREEQ